MHTTRKFTRYFHEAVCRQLSVFVDGAVKNKVLIIQSAEQAFSG